MPGSAGSRRLRSVRCRHVPSGATGRLPPNAGRIAADIGTAALELAKQANGAGLTTLGYLLESAALEAGAEAASYDCPADAAQR